MHRHLTLKRRAAAAATSLLLTAAAAAGALALPGTAGAAAPSDEYVALGDSYSSGNGTGSANLSYGCYRSSNAYAPIIADQRRRTSLAFKACSGATTVDVVNNQISALSAGTDFVTFTAGGNDVGFVDLILSCWGNYDQSQCLATADEVNRKIDNDLPARLDSLHAAVGAAAPNALVMQLGYGRPFGANLGCAQANGITSAERTALNGVVDHLDSTIAERAAANGITYISVIGAFTGHDVCANDPWLVGKYAWDVRDVYHPTASGHRDGYVPLVRALMG